MAFVRKRGRRLSVRYVDESGFSTEKTTKAATRSEAQRMADDLERRAERVRLGLENAVLEISVRDAYEKHFAPIRAGDAGFDTMNSRFTRHILPELGELLVHQVKPSHVMQLLASRAKSWKDAAGDEQDALSPATREHIRVELSALFTFVINKLKAFTGEHPVRAVEKVRVPEQPPKYLEVEEVAAALDTVPDRWRGFVAVAVYTGLRFSELRRLRVNEVDMSRGLLAVWDTKNTKARFVPIPDELVPFLKVELGRARSEWLFPRKDGTQLTKDCRANDRFKRALKRAGILIGYDHLCRTRGKGRGCGFKERRADNAPFPCPKCGRHLEVAGVPKPFTFKDLRSTFATHAAEQTRDLRAVQRAMGHGSIAVTEKKYAFARDLHLKNQLSGLSLGFARPAPAEKDESNQPQPVETKVSRLPLAANRRETQAKPTKPNPKQAQPKRGRP